MILQYEVTMNIKCKYSSYYTNKINAKWNATVENLTNQVADESDLENFCTQVHCIVTTAQHHQCTKLGAGVRGWHGRWELPAQRKAIKKWQGTGSHLKHPPSSPETNQNKS